ncbi:MAG: hypothetical protein FJY92_08835, partial [Candidatus Hydrogenedentes bacterium]|nr:hypothetical protein [Candidatus Hydrogenedentota bacterium]
MRAMLIIAAHAAGVVACAGVPAIEIEGWDQHFAFRYDYVVTETSGQARANEPVEITLSVPGGAPAAWEHAARVVRLESPSRGVIVPHQVLDKTAATSLPPQTAGAPAESVNVVFLSDCPARGTVAYRLFWGPPKDGAPRADLPSAAEPNGLQVTGEAPGLTVENERYRIQLDPKSGAILRARLAGHPESEDLFYRSIPIHFGVDVWSPPQGWDHDYDWKSPPHQSLERGPLVTRYRRWGPLERYLDVEVSIAYTFYAHTPYVHVSSTMRFTADRSVRAVRMGEIVVAHSHSAPPNEKDADGQSPDLLTHYAWPGADGAPQVLDIDAHRSADGAANLAGVVPGALAILDRDVAWVAGYNAAKDYGIATLRLHQFAGNTLGGAVPRSVPCTYVSNYGWGFTYWSRPMVYPPGAKDSPEDQNTAVAAGTLFGVDEALL